MNSTFPFAIKELRVQKELKTQWQCNVKCTVMCRIQGADIAENSLEPWEGKTCVWEMANRKWFDGESWNSKSVADPWKDLNVMCK